VISEKHIFQQYNNNNINIIIIFLPLINVIPREFKNLMEKEEK